MKSSHILAAGLLGMTAFLTGQARADIITFDDLPDMSVVLNHYPRVTFTAGGSDVVLTTAQGGASGFQTSSPFNLICTGIIGSIDCIQDLILTFSTPVDNLSFDAFGNQTPISGLPFPGPPAGPGGTSNGVFATADVYEGGSATPTVTQNLLVTHTQAQVLTANCQVADCLSDPQTLNYTDITKVVLHESAYEATQVGTAYDNFSFTPEGLPTPEPSTLFLTGLCGIAWAGRRFLARKSM